MQCIVQGLATNYVRTGKGERVLFLHGWGDSLETFQKLQAVMGEAYEYIALDLPGFGGTQMPDTPYDLDLYADFVRSFLLKIGVDSLSVTIGHSNGGAIAVKAISSGKIRTKKLILLASSGIRTPNSMRHTFLRIGAKFAKVIIAGLPSIFQQKVKKWLYRLIGSEQFVAVGMQETFRKIVAEDIRNQASEITIPTLLLYGSLDTATPPNMGRILSDAIKNSKYIEVDGAGHFLHQTHVKVVKNEIIEFLA